MVTLAGVLMCHVAKIRLMVERLICSVCLDEHPKMIGSSLAVRCS
jgi:hypothetical protein